MLKLFKRRKKTNKHYLYENCTYNCYIETIPLEYVERIKEHEMYGDIMDVRYHPKGKFFNVYIKIK